MATKYNQIILADIRSAIDGEDGIGAGLVHAGDLIRKFGAPVSLIDHGVRTAMAHNLPCLAHHIAVGGASQKCVEELYRWCVVRSTVAPRHLRYAPAVAEILERQLTKGEV